MRFARIGPKAKRRLDGRLSQRQARRRVIPAIEVNVVVSPSQLAIRLEKSRVMRDSLVQQIGRLEQISLSLVRWSPQQYPEEILGAVIKIESSEIGCWWALNGQFLRG